MRTTTSKRLSDTIQSSDSTGSSGAGQVQSFRDVVTSSVSNSKFFFEIKEK